jgi:hypothetical protein
MQNWRDNMQLFQPGYRDRVVHISLAPDEGGTNLKMDESITAALSERGRYAGVKLRDRFAGDPGTAATEGWDNHRWVRYRSTMAVLERMLRNLHTGYCQPIAGEQSYAEMIGRSYKTPPSSYRWNPVAQRVFATRATAGLIRVIEEWNDQPERFSRNAPQPEPELRIMPRM